ncbi:hypothetical protein K438DRAFT_2036551 [Mycena galopus ATCC 62051]|nr:hypothetical protein K438DRAFT_2036551 [Mycena galopus ATCC 62051]
MKPAQKKLTKDQKTRCDKQIREISVGEQFMYQSTGAAGVSERTVKAQAPTETALTTPAIQYRQRQIDSNPRVTHNAKVICDFEDYRARLGDAMLSHERDPDMGKPFVAESASARRCVSNAVNIPPLVDNVSSTTTATSTFTGSTLGRGARVLYGTTCR